MAIFENLSNNTTDNMLISAKLNPSLAEIYQGYLLNKIRKMQDRNLLYSAGFIDSFAEAYVDANGQANTVNTTNTTALFRTNKYTVLYFYVEIEASAIPTPANFSINNCVLQSNGTGKWFLYSTSATKEVQRAEVMKTLFYGTDGSNARASSTYITGITALKSSDSRDVGKRAYYAQQRQSINLVEGGTPSYYTGTFADASTNTDASFWSYCSATTGNFYGRTSAASFSCPSATTLNSVNVVTYPVTTTSDETATDTSAEQKTNPATCVLYNDKNATTSDTHNTCRAIIICSGSISWAKSGASSTFSNIDFYTTNNIPLFTYAVIDSVIYHTIPSGTFPTTITGAIGVPLISDWETGADIKYRLYFGTDVKTEWLDCGNSPKISNIYQVGLQPTAVEVKLIQTSSSPTDGVPAIHGFALRLS
jgi:hypothetical protein